MTRTRTTDATFLIALAAATWGLDGWIRGSLARTLDPGTVVLWEHIIAVTVLLPSVPRALRAFVRCSVRAKVAVVLVGVGASAVATALFTEAFAISVRSGDFVTPLVLQNLQPLVAIALAVVLLRERLHVRFLFFVVPALVGAWLLSIASPLHPQVGELKTACFALGATVLWGAGTALGRLLSAELESRDITTLRFVFGLLGAIVVVQVTGARVAPGWHAMPRLVLLSIVIGLLALQVYYYALARTPAARATLAELAFPATAAVVGVCIGDRQLVTSQWCGFAIVVASVLALSWFEHRPRPSVEPAPSQDGLAPSIR